MNYEKIFMLYLLEEKLSLKDKILLHIFKDYTYRIYMKWIKKGFDCTFNPWQNTINTLKLH